MVGHKRKRESKRDLEVVRKSVPRKKKKWGKTGSLATLVRPENSTFEEKEFLKYIEKSFYLSDVGNSESSFAVNQNYGNRYGVLGGKQVLLHQLNPYAMMKMVHSNSTLSSCVNAMATNVAGHGLKIVYKGKEGEHNSEEAKRELRNIENRLENLNPHESLETLLEKQERDIHTLGYGALEVIRNRRGDITNLFYFNPDNLYICVDKTWLEVETVYTVNGRKRIKKSQKEFRLFTYRNGNSVTYYKDFGDPRTIDPLTGEENNELTFEESATELYFDGEHTTGTNYPLPVWFGAYAHILGSREAALCNLEYFKNNEIPAMLVTVSGGYLTEDTFEDLSDLFDRKANRQNQHRVVVLEAAGDPEAAATTGAIPPPTVNVKSLVDERQTDAQFQDYEKNTERKIMQAFRIPPILLGDSKDSSYAAAEASVILAESQVFAPRRKKRNEFINNHILTRFGKKNKYYEVNLLPINFISPDSVAKTIKAFENVGAMTPNVGIEMINQLFDMNVERVEEPWGDYPFTFSKILTSLGRMRDLDEIQDLTRIQRALNEIMPDQPSGGQNNQGNSETNVRSATTPARSEASLATTNNLGSVNTTNITRDASNE
jgi:PBSX family phage portal protein